MATAAAQPDQASNLRLVIRVRLAPDTPAPSADPQRFRTRAFALVGAAVVLSMLTWIAVSMREPARDADERTTAAAMPTAPQTRAVQPAPAVAAARTPETASPPATTREQPASSAPVSPAPEEPARPLAEILPEVPQSALQTIRGTVRVTIRATIDARGQVRSVTAQDAGPSRYFERLSLEAARKWTFTPSRSQQERVMLVRFHYTADGATAQARAP
jgi:TonB family protein